MSELPPYQPEPGNPEYIRTPEEAKRFEAQQIAQLTDILWAFFHGRAKGEGVDMMDADAALDMVADLVASLGQRDPEMALILIEELESGPGPHAEVEETITNQLRQMLGLPSWQPSLPPPTTDTSPPSPERE